ncbi:hypothetical protein GCM10022207_11180 [Streptomyces lannensis]|uniref:Uncharacterized protein n=1 Tax=Streptomyces lannensis TaxID=766498 RepID=A0ABP7JQT3_9ACTN
MESGYGSRGTAECPQTSMAVKGGGRTAVDIPVPGSAALQWVGPPLERVDGPDKQAAGSA